MNIDIKRFDKKQPLPGGEDGAACFDFYCRVAADIKPHELKPVYLNNAMKIPKGYVLLLFSRSSTPIKKNLMLANGVGVIDPFYCGDEDEIMALFYNFSDTIVHVNQGDRIAQGMIIKTENISWNEVNNMGSKGHGGYHHL